MRRAFARVVMALALAGVPACHGDWAGAMRAEFAVAAHDGRPLSFALGCLVAAGRLTLTCEEGWFRLARYGLVLALLLPMAALQVGCALFGLPYLYPGGDGLPGALVEGRDHEALIRGIYQAAVPALSLLLLLIAASHVWIAWALLDADWDRVRRCCLVALAASVTLLLLMVSLFLDAGQAALQAAILAVELVTIRTAAWWHLRSPTAIVPDRRA